MEKFLYPSHPVRCIITGPSDCGKSVFLTNLFLNIINEYDKMYIYSPSLHQDIYQKLNKCFSNHIHQIIISNFLNEEGIDIVIEEIVNNRDFEKSDIEMETYESIEHLKFPKEYEYISLIILDDLNQKQMDDPRVQAMFKRSRHKNLSIFIIIQDYYELSKKTKRCNGNIYHKLKPKNFRDVINLYQDKASMDMNLIECKLLTSVCWNKSYQPLTVDIYKR